MSDLSVTVVLPSGGARRADVPADVPVRECLWLVRTAVQWVTVSIANR
jgi:hypothetical protein